MTSHHYFISDAFDEGIHCLIKRLQIDSIQTNNAVPWFIISIL